MHTDPLLQVKNLCVSYDPQDRNAVDQVSFSVRPGEIVGLVGESGCGKSSIALSILGLLKDSAQVSGQILFRGTDLRYLGEEELDEQMRWKKIAIVFQNSLDVLNPVLSLRTQIAECLERHLGMTGPDAEERMENLFLQVGLEPLWLDAYPHELSGGMRQKALIAMALSCNPELLLVDEPTSALDPEAREGVLNLLGDLCRRNDMGTLLISHDMDLIAKLSDRAMVMYAGHLVECGPTREILQQPLHPYTRGLITSSPSISLYRDLWGIPENFQPVGPGCAFYGRCTQKNAQCQQRLPELVQVQVGRKVACLRGGIVTLLKAERVGKSYGRRSGSSVQACQDCSLQVRSGEVVALVGPSGSGKSTLANILAGLLRPDSGQVFFEGRRVQGNSETSRREGIQMVFQDPISATSDHFSIEEVVREPLDILGHADKEKRRQEARDALCAAGLPSDGFFLQRKCHTLSGGQRQRVALARALVMQPKLLIADEINSALDPSTQANLMRHLKGLQNSRGFSMLLITHDLALARKIADQVLFIQKGQMGEPSSATEVASSSVWSLAYG
ncbi:MAG TPA: ABC transporter ATP-binding protein [Fibrobacteraceae bacterium]|nr:ABC transporter ATP-binding protein [Fibrobacteraceae bacterium]